MKNNVARGQALLILYKEGHFINLNHFTSNCLMITFILASIFSDVMGGRAVGVKTGGSRVGGPELYV